MALFPKLTRKKTLALATACMMSAIPAFAQEEDMEDLDLGELFDLNMEVTVASKKAEKLSDAPGMIVAYSEKDIQNMGYYTINDLANMTTGYSSYYAYGERILESRGQKARSFNNNKHLLLIDGIPVHNARNYKAPIEEVTLLGADRVEFLKGPGSALYGTGAFYGVVSVVPKTLQENGAWAKGMMTLSSQDFSKRVMASSVVKKDMGTFSASASYFDKDASETNTMTVTPDSLGNHSYNGFEGGDTTDMNQLDYDDVNSQFVNMSYKLTGGALEGLGFGFIYTRKSGGLGESWGGPSSKVLNILWESAIPYIKYQREMTDRFSLNSYVKGNYSIEEGGGNGWSYGSQVANLEVLAEGNLDFDNAGALIFGVNYDLRKELSKTDYFNGSFGTAGNDVDYWDPSLLFHTISAYAQYQVEFPVLSGMKLTAGVRSDNGISNEASGAASPMPPYAELDREGNKFTKVSPRAGIVQKFSDKLNAKLLYGSALRSPGIKEFGLIEESRNTIAIIGSDTKLDDVGAEVINTFEGSVNLTLSKVKATVGGYYNITTDALDGYSLNVKDSVGNDTLLNVFGNSEFDIKGGGFEIDIQAMPIKQLKIMAGMSYGKSYAENEVMNIDTTGVDQFDTTYTDVKEQVYGVPTGKINAAISYNHDGAFKFGITPSLKYFMGYRLEGDAELSDGDLKDKNSITDGHVVLDLNVLLPVNEHLGFEVMGRNLTNTEFYQPGENGITAVNPKIKGPSVAVSLVGQF